MHLKIDLCSYSCGAGFFNDSRSRDQTRGSFDHEKKALTPAINILIEKLSENLLGDDKTQGQ